MAFSKSGFWLDWKRDGADPAADLLRAYTTVLAEARPRYFICENVYALTFRNRTSGPAFAGLLKGIEAAGYHYGWEVLNAADYGVPQLRPRLFIVGARKGEVLPALPDASHYGSWERRRTGGGSLPHVTAGEALDGLVTEPEREADLKARLLEQGHLLPLPTEPAALANLVEIELREHLVAAADTSPGVKIRLGTERSYPDIELAGPTFGDRNHAADIKCARR